MSSTTDPAVPADLARYLRQLEERVGKLERSNPLQRASAHDGTETRVEVGEFTNPTTGADDFGVIVRNDSGLIVWAVGGDGPLYPAFNFGGFWKSGDFVAVTSASFATQYSISPIGTGMPTLQISFTVSVDAATAGEVRGAITHTGTEYSNTISLPALTNGTAVLSLQLSSLTDVDDGWTGEATTDALESLLVEIQGRRTSGSGNVNVYHPQSAVMYSSEVSAGNVLASSLTAP